MENKLKALENKAGINSLSGDGTCACPMFKQEIRTYMGAEDNHVTADADTRAGEVCDRCGQEKQVIKLVLVHTREQVREH
jgi:hypothetical protein